MHSHHSHSGQFCAHAKDDLAAILERARSLGFTHFHLTEHCPREHAEHLYPEEVAASLSPEGLSKRFRAYLSHARSLQQLHERKDFQVLVGCETENLNGEGQASDSISFLIKELELLHERDAASIEPALVGLDVVDFLVGSVHHVNGIPIDFDKATFDRACERFREPGDADEVSRHRLHAKLIIEYLERQYELMQRLRPEVIGHVDLFRLYRPDFVLKSENPSLPEMAQVWSLLQRNVRYAAAYGALFEANSAALRKGWPSSYPGPEILRLILECGGRVCLSDDSHGLDYIALNYPRMKDYLVSAGVQDVWVLERDAAAGWTERDKAAASEEAVQARAAGTDRIRDAPQRFPRGTKAICIRGDDWQKHAFWDNAELRNT